MNILIMGPAGAGKGTMSDLILKSYDIPHISTGDMLRENIRNDTSLGRKAKSYMDQGRLVPDDVINAMVEARLKQDDCARGYLLDGFPRTLVQAQALDAIGQRTGRPVEAVLALAVPLAVLQERITGRRICPKCGAIYHIKNHPSRVEGICDECGSTLVQRPDDTLEKLTARMEEYDNLTKPVIAYYQKQGLVHEIDAAQNAEATFAQVEEVLKELA
jgi:adenylate kinase